MVDDDLVPELLQGFGHSVGHVNGAMTSTRTSQCHAEVGFQFGGVPGQEVRYQVQDPIDGFIHLRERAKPICDRLIISRIGAKLLFEKRIGEKPNIENEARSGRNALLVRKALDLQRHRWPVSFPTREGQHLPSQIVWRQLRGFEDDIGEVANALESLAFFRNRLLEAELAEWVWTPRDRKPPQQNLGRRFDKDQTEGLELFFELPKKLWKALDHPLGPNIENYNQTVHFPIGSFKQTRHELQRDIVDANIADILKAATEHGFPSAG
jgi:hypothetical protein